MIDAVIGQMLKDVPPRPAIERAVMDGLEAALHIRVVLGEVTTSERRDAERLVATRYGTPAWTWGRSSRDGGDAVLVLAGGAGLRGAARVVSRPDSGGQSA